MSFPTVKNSKLPFEKKNLLLFCWLLLRKENSMREVLFECTVQKSTNMEDLVFLVNATWQGSYFCHVKFSHVVLGIDLWCFCGLCCYGWKSSTEWGPGRGAVVLSPHALYLTFRWLQRSVWSNPQRYQCVPVSRHCSQTYLRTHQTARAPEIPHPPHLAPLSGHHTM